MQKIVLPSLSVTTSPVDIHLTKAGGTGQSAAPTPPLNAQTSIGTSQRFLGVPKGRLEKTGGPFASELSLRLIIKLIIPRQKLN